MRLEITIHRLGGEEGPRHFAATSHDLDPTAGTIHFQDVVSADNPAYFMRITLRELIPAQEDFVSCIAGLDLPDGQMIATRPVLIYDQVCDVPVWTTFQNPRAPYLGVYSVGLRRVS